MMVLIVDDHAINLRLMRALLEAEGLEVIEARDGVEALEILERQPVDAIISDILMPRMDGYRLCSEVRHRENLRHLPFIICTATYTSPADEKLCLDLGADKYLRKPVSAEELMAALAAASPATQRRQPTATPPETEILKEYNERLIAKLEQKNVELTQRTRELEAAQKNLAHVLAHTPAVIYTLTIDGDKITPIVVSGNIESISGYTIAEASSYDWWLQSLHPDDHDRVIASLREGIPRGGCSMEYRLRRKDGAYRWVEDHNRVWRDESGRPAQAAGILRDITEKRELEAKFLRSQRLENIGALAGGIAHDLNNALAPILMAAQCLADGCAPEQKRMLDIIYSSAKRSTDMVRQVLAFARGTEGKRSLVQPAHLMRDMAEIARHTFPKTIEVHTHIAAKTWVVRSNPTELHQVLLNLAVNARDAMSGQGILTLTTANVQLDTNSCAIDPDAKPGPYVALTVGDTGAGMTPEIRARIFDPFFTTKDPGKGTGLGLSTVRTIVRDHGGFLAIKTAPNEGSQFSVYLPAEPESSERLAEEIPPAVRPSGKGQFILLVDDEATIRNMAAQTLETYGYTVLTAADGALGVSLCVQHLREIQMVISDMDMPTIDGLTLVRAIRAFAPRMKIVIASGSDLVMRTQALRDLSVTTLLHKPYGADDLLRIVAETLGEGAMSAPQVDEGSGFP